LYFVLLGLQKQATTMKIKSAAIAQKIEPIGVTNWGTISQIYVREGMEVEAGQPLLRVRNDLKIQQEIIRIESLINQQTEKVEKLTEKLSLSRLELAETQLELQKTEALESQEKSTIAPQSNIAQSRLESAKATLQALTTQYQVAQDNYQRFSNLFQEGGVSQKVVDESSAKLADLEGKMKKAQEELQIAQTILVEVKKGHFLDHNRLVNKLQPLIIEKENIRQKGQLTAQKINIIEQSLEQQKQKLETLKKQKQALENPGKNLDNSTNNNFSTVYKAPVSGTITKLLKSSGNTVMRNEDLIFLKQNLERPIIDAYLTTAQAQQVAIGSEATVLIPLSDKFYQAEVIEIDPTGGFVDEVRGQYQFQGSLGKPALVKLQITDPTLADSSHLSVGTPVILNIKKENHIVQNSKFLLRKMLY
ncbi:MAG: HlyD family efflux transporter periplasmic adaptor subunit, partial [Xenococcaceae cyanobacterium MO_167.B52]|nr:HlyD family efflux transporter periplasmic adaptor subunit [Xenococcaceae cyanobacterium MO_167.B52]